MVTSRPWHVGTQTPLGASGSQFGSSKQLTTDEVSHGFPFPHPAVVGAVVGARTAVSFEA